PSNLSRPVPRFLYRRSGHHARAPLPPLVSHRSRSRTRPRSSSYGSIAFTTPAAGPASTCVAISPLQIMATRAPILCTLLMSSIPPTRQEETARRRGLCRLQRAQVLPRLSEFAVIRLLRRADQTHSPRTRQKTARPRQASSTVRRGN